MSAKTTVSASTGQNRDSKFGKWLKTMKDNYPFLVMVFPAVLVVFLFNSIVNVVLLIIANTTSKKFSENSLW